MSKHVGQGEVSTIKINEYHDCKYDPDTDTFTYTPRGRSGLMERGATYEQIHQAIGYLVTRELHRGQEITISIWPGGIWAVYDGGFMLVGVWRSAELKFSFHS